MPIAALAFLKSNWRSLLLAGMVCALGIMWLLYGAEKQRSAKWEARAAAEIAAHDVTRSSLAGARSHIDDNNRRIAEANQRLEDARRNAAANEARANARWRSTAETIAELEAAARDGSGAPCEVSPGALRALEGL